MTLFLSMTRHTGIRVAEVGMALGALGGAALLVGGMMPFGRRVGMVLGGLGIAAGGVLMIIAIRYGGFG